MHTKKLESEEVLSKPLAFKAQLAIGENAYKSLRYGKNLQGMWDVYGVGAAAVGIANAPIVASTIGVKVGALSFIGIGTFATPLPYVALAAAGTTAAYVGVMQYVKKLSNERLEVIPKFINSPLDILAIRLFGLIAPIVMKTAQIDGKISEEEYELITEYFSDDWGYSKEFLEQSLDVIAEQVKDSEIENLLEPFCDYVKNNSDCNQKEIAKNITQIICEVAESDGIVTEDEQTLIDAVESYFKEQNRYAKKLTNSLRMVWAKHKKT